MVRRTLICAALLSALLPIGCGGNPSGDSEVDAWTIDVPAGTSVKKYPPVFGRDRAGREIELVESLVLGGDESDPNTRFYRVQGIAASPAGDIYVLDSGNSRVQMFSRDGSYVKTLGSIGDGPGEFQRPDGIAIAGDRIAVNDSVSRRLTFWSLDGEYVDELRPPLRISARMAVLPDFSIVAAGSAIDRAQMVRRPTLSRYSAQGDLLDVILALSPDPMPDLAATRADPLAMLQMAAEAVADPSVISFVSSQSIIYATPMAEYQVFAKSPEGEWLWALKVAWPRPPFPDAQKKAMVDSFVARIPDLTVESVDWPDHVAALRAIQVDGQGRLYVFPTPGEAADAGISGKPPLNPVDVYSSEGEQLMAGLIGSSWSYAQGDYVYAVRTNAAGAEEVVRYRLVWPAS